MISEKLFRRVDRVAREERVRTAILLTRDVIDYFVDVARVTDRVEMGGFVLGKVWKGYATVLAFYDYVQVRNVSSTPEKAFLPDEESKEEVYRMIIEGRYDVFAEMHTHPDESGFSAADLLSCRQFSEKTGKSLLMKLKKFRELGIKELAFPDFLVSDGKRPLLQAYTYKVPFVFVGIADRRLFYVRSRLLSRTDKAYFKFLTEDALRLADKFEVLVTLDYIMDTISHCYYVVIRIEDLEKFLSDLA